VPPIPFQGHPPNLWPYLVTIISHLFSLIPSTAIFNHHNYTLIQPYPTLQPYLITTISPLFNLIPLSHPAAIYNHLNFTLIQPNPSPQPYLITIIPPLFNLMPYSTLFHPYSTLSHPTAIFNPQFHPYSALSHPQPYLITAISQQVKCPHQNPEACKHYMQHCFIAEKGACSTKKGWSLNLDGKTLTGYFQTITKQFLWVCPIYYRPLQWLRLSLAQKLGIFAINATKGLPMLPTRFVVAAG
jgi:hypothetical protein